MSLLIPLGLLGLIGVLGLIIIYIIRPNYQQKFIPSTYVWKLSLKYKKKTIPINHIKNIILFICQLLILAICGTLLAQPVIAYEHVATRPEKVMIIDASASMLLTDGSATRFERAVEQVKDLAEITVEEGGAVTVIIADEEANYVLQSADVESKDTIILNLDELLMGETQCTYGSADYDGAVALAEETLLANPEAEIMLFTATEFIDKNGIEVVDVSDENEWNAAILNCVAEYDNNNHYEITVDVGCYDEETSLTVNCVVHGVNGSADTLEVHKTEYFDVTEQEKTVRFTTDDFGANPLYEFSYLQVYVSVADSLQVDNWYFVYGGVKEEIKIQYASSFPNNFFAGAIRTMRENFKSNWDINFTEVKAGEEPESEGFDLYIYEHEMPETLPTDGIILLVDPDSAPKDVGFTVIGDPEEVNEDSTLASGTTHPITRFLSPNSITIAKYNKIAFSDDYIELMYYSGEPVIAVKDLADSKIVVLAMDLHFSNLSVTLDFPILMYNMFNYFIPSTFSNYSYEIGETVDFTPRGSGFNLSTPDGVNHDYKILETGLKLLKPGSYTTMQYSLRGEYIIENFYVNIPNLESNVTKQVDELPEMSVEQTLTSGYDDLLLYFAIALVALLMIEWFIYSREQI